MINQPIYFGCYKESGHYPFDRNMSRIRDFHLRRYINQFDGLLCVNITKGINGIASINYLYNRTITAIAFWDNSIDKRPGSNSCFFIPGYFSKEEAIDIAKEYFPKVFEQIKFELI